MNTDCIIWHGRVAKDGYGRCTFTDSSGRRTPGYGAHRAAYEKVHGPIPNGLTVDHLCFTRACVNVTHMRLLTRSENCANQRKARSSHCKRGHEYTTDNTYRSLTDGSRQCRRCNAAAARRYKARKQMAA